MKLMLTSLPIIAVVRRAMPIKRKQTIGSLLLLKILPGWAVAVAIVGFVWAFRSRSAARRAVVEAEAADLR